MSKASKTLGILSIVTGLFIPIAGLTLGIIGISIKKEPKDYNKCITLNTIGISVSLIVWAITFMMILSLPY